MSGHAVLEARNEALFCSLVICRQQECEQIQAVQILGKYLAEGPMRRVFITARCRVRRFFDYRDFREHRTHAVCRLEAAWSTRIASSISIA